MTSRPARGLTPAQIVRFASDGFVRVDDAFSSRLAAEVRERLWRDLPGEPEIPGSWIQPVVRLGMYSEAAFIEAANTPVLHATFDQLAGPARWRPCQAMGTFPVRFPAPDDPSDAGWHIDVSFGDDPDFLNWRANARSRGRCLLMLFLFSDVGPDDAPTRIRTGSHKRVARLLEGAGEDGLTLRELAASDFGGDPGRGETLATGPAGTVYLCHPFLVHAAQAHRGATPRSWRSRPCSRMTGPTAALSRTPGSPLRSGKSDPAPARRLTPRRGHALCRGS